jgi:hypothetical protein
MMSVSPRFLSLSRFDVGTRAFLRIMMVSLWLNFMICYDRVFKQIFQATLYERKIHVLKEPPAQPPWFRNASIEQWIPRKTGIVS